MEPGRYVGMAWSVRWATVERDGVSVPLEPQGSDGEALVDIDFILDPGRSRTLFAQWFVGASLCEEDGFLPKLTVSEQRIELAASLVFVSNVTDSSLTVINRFLGQVVGSIAVGPAPMGLVSSPGGERLYVASYGGQCISVVDVAAEQVVDSFGNLGRAPTELALSADGELLFVANPASDCVTIIDTAMGQPVRVVDVGRNPSGIVFDAERNRVYVANTGSGTLSVIDGNSLEVMRTVIVGQAPRGLAVVEDTLFVTDAGTSSLWAVDLPSYNVSVAMSASSRGGNLLRGPYGMVYMTAPMADELTFVQTATRSAVKRVRMSAAPGQMGLDTTHGKLYVVCGEADELAVVDASMRKIDSLIQVGRRPHGVAVIDE
ncbi:YVTN family beta-propeller repeat protein [Desulfoplanes sp. PS50]